MFFFIIYALCVDLFSEEISVEIFKRYLNIYLAFITYEDSTKMFYYSIHYLLSQ